MSQHLANEGLILTERDDVRRGSRVWLEQLVVLRRCFELRKRILRDADAVAFLGRTDLVDVRRRLKDGGEVGGKRVVVDGRRVRQIELKLLAACTQHVHGVQRSHPDAADHGPSMR